MTTDSESQARAQLETIVAAVKRLEHAEGCAGHSLCLDFTVIQQWMADSGWYKLSPEEAISKYHNAEDAREAIEEHPLSIEVRSGWYSPGAADADMKPAEYTILLCTGGPAVRIIGELNEHGEPTSARLEHQDWGTPWTEYRLGPIEYESDLITYACQFYYGG